MLNFIVLGLIPGTHLQITFSWIMLVAALVLMYIELRYHEYLKLTATVVTAPQQTTLAIANPRRYTWSLVVGQRQYILSIEL